MSGDEVFERFQPFLLRRLFRLFLKVGSALHVAIGDDEFLFGVQFQPLKGLRGLSEIRGIVLETFDSSDSTRETGFRQRAFFSREDEAVSCGVVKVSCALGNEPMGSDIGRTLQASDSEDWGLTYRFGAGIE